MKMIKHFPPHFAQLVFLNLDGEIERINGLDYDLFIWLIYRTHKHYSKTKDTFVEFEYMDIRESLPSKPNTKSIQSSLKKINEIQLLSNYLNSYENKEAILTTTPFKINIKPSDNGKSYGFSVASSKNFLQRFDNPTPKVSVNYIIIYKLNKMSKLLYLFLKDALGVYKNKNRKVDIEKLRHLMNISNDDTSHSNFITQLKKSTKNINEFSDIDVGYKVIKKRDLRSGKSEIIYELAYNHHTSYVDERYTKSYKKFVSEIRKFGFVSIFTNLIENHLEFLYKYKVNIDNSVNEYSRNEQELIRSIQKLYADLDYSKFNLLENNQIPYYSKIKLKCETKISELSKNKKFDKYHKLATDLNINNEIDLFKELKNKLNKKNHHNYNDFVTEFNDRDNIVNNNLISKTELLETVNKTKNMYKLKNINDVEIAINEMKSKLDWNYNF